MADERAQIFEIPEETDMIKKPYLDRLANIQYQKNLEKKELKESKKRIKEEEKRVQVELQPYWQVGLFLKAKFPDAFSESELASLPQNEFKELLRRSRNWLWRRAAIYYSGFLASIGPAVGSVILVSIFPNMFTGILFLASLIGGLFGCVFSGIFIYTITRVILNKASRGDYRELEQGN